MRTTISEMAVEASTNRADGWLTRIARIQHVAEKMPSAVQPSIVLSDGDARTLALCDPFALSVKTNGLRDAGFLTSCSSGFLQFRFPPVHKKELLMKPRGEDDARSGQLRLSTRSQKASKSGSDPIASCRGWE